MAATLPGLHFFDRPLGDPGRGVVLLFQVGFEDTDMLPVFGGQNLNTLAKVGAPNGRFSPSSPPVPLTFEQSSRSAQTP
ncbi:MAG: hypothetical protein VCE12_16610, partial [Candidatus Latescibacterota bacterium]